MPAAQKLGNQLELQHNSIKLRNAQSPTLGCNTHNTQLNTRNEAIVCYLIDTNRMLANTVLKCVQYRFIHDHIIIVLSQPDRTGILIRSIWIQSSTLAHTNLSPEFPHSAILFNCCELSRESILNYVRTDCVTQASDTVTIIISTRNNILCMKSKILEFRCRRSVSGKEANSRTMKILEGRQMRNDKCEQSTKNRNIFVDFVIKNVTTLRQSLEFSGDH